MQCNPPDRKPRDAEAQLLARVYAAILAWPTKNITPTDTLTGQTVGVISDAHRQNADARGV